MKPFKKYLDEHKITGMNISTYRKVLFNSFLEFLNDYFNTNISIKLTLKKLNSKHNGSVDIVKIKNKIYNISLNKEMGDVFAMSLLAHEFTHIIQVLKGHLDFTKDGKSILWKNEEWITVKEYSAMKEYDIYKKLPWEKEAVKNGKKLKDIYFKSRQYKELKGKDKFLDYIINNNFLN